MFHRIRLLLLIPHLSGGGAEHVIALLARTLSQERYEVHLGVITQKRSESHALPSHIRVHALGASRVRSSALSLLRLVWQLRPEVVLSGMAHLNFLVLLLRPFFPHRTRVMVRQNATASADLPSSRLPRYTRPFYRSLYPLVDLVICQSQAMAQDLAATAHLDPERIAVLPNPVDLDAIRAAAEAPSNWTGPGPHLLAIGRLAAEKGFDLLIDALAQIRKRYPHADLLIVGEGPRRACLEFQSMCLGLRSAVRFVGYVERPYAFFPEVDLFVLSSRLEGLPNVLLEAAAAGLPLVATPASGRVADLLRNRPGTWLTREVSSASLAETILTALDGIDPRQRFHHQFLIPATDAIRAYEEAIDAVSAPSFTHAPGIA